MVTDRWQRVKELFGAALERSAAAREAYLREACGDEGLRREVESLLAAHGKVGHFLSDSASLAEAEATPQALAPGSRLGGYEIVARLGAGGMGTVLEAFDRATGERCALKVLHRIDPAALYRIKREFRSLADVSHPNLIRFRELFVLEDAPPFFTMDLVEGVTLLEHVDRCRSGPAGTTALRGVFHELASGIAAIHRAGKLHRDLKPTNVLVRADGRVVILDFGLACDLPSPTADRATLDAGAGTPHYMAPEQAARGALGPWSDWYAFGVILYTALAGRLPFGGGLDEVFRLKHERRPAAPSLHRLDVPSDLERLCLDLLERDPERRPTGEETLARLAGAAAPAPEAVEPPGTISPALVGRHEEHARMVAALVRARAGQQVTVLVLGESGIGKTSLVRRFLDEARRDPDLLVFAGRCYENEAIPFKALDGVVDALAQHLSEPGPEAAPAFVPPHVNALCRVFLALSRVPSLAHAPASSLPADLGDVRRLAFDALKALFAHVAQSRTLVLFVDDLQWGDADGARLFATLLAPPDPLPMLFVGCCRGDERASSPFLSTLESGDAFCAAWRPIEVQLGPLSAPEALAVCRSLGGQAPTADIDAIVASTGGSPLFLTELAMYLRGARQEAAPQGLGLSQVIRSRVARLDPRARRLLEVVALSDGPLPSRIAGAVAVTGAELRNRVHDLKAQRLLRTIYEQGGDERLETYHDRIRETVVAELSPDTRRDLHRDMAGALEEAGGEPEALSRHLAEAGERASAGVYAVRAAESSYRALAFGHAARWFGRALELGPPDEAERHRLSVRLADSLAYMGNGRDAAELYLAEAGRIGDSEEVLDLRRRAAEQLLTSGYRERGLAVLEQVLGAAGLANPRSDKSAVLHLLLQRAALRVGGLGFARRRSEEIAKNRLLWADAAAVAAAGFTRTDPVRGALFATVQLRRALAVGEIGRIARALCIQAFFVSAKGVAAARRADELLALAEPLVEEVGDPLTRCFFQACAGGSQMHRGQWARAIDYFERAERVLKAHTRDRPWELTYTRVQLTVCRQLHGLWPETAEELSRWVRDARERNDLEGQRSFVSSWALAMLTLDRTEEARAELTALFGLLRDCPPDVPVLQAAVADTLGKIYCGADDAELSRTEAFLEGLLRSMLGRAQVARVLVIVYIASCRIVRAARARDPEPELRPVDRMARRLGRERADYALAYEPFLRGSAAHVRGRDEAAAEHLQRAMNGFLAAHQLLHAEAVRRQLGLITAGDAGRVLVATADERMRGRGVVRPDRVAEMLVPGFAGP